MRSKTDEGCEEARLTAPYPASRDTPHPALTGHLLPKGEKGQNYCAAVVAFGFRYRSSQVTISHWVWPTDSRAR